MSDSFVIPRTVACQARLLCPGISQARILEWVAISSSSGSSRPRNLNLCLLHLLHCRRILYHRAPLCLVAKSCPTVCEPLTVACQAPCPWGFSRQEYFSGWPCPPPGDLPDPGIEPCYAWIILKTLLNLFFSFSCILAALLGMQDFSSPTRELTGDSCNGIAVSLNHGTTREVSLLSMFKLSLAVIIMG